MSDSDDFEFPEPRGTGMTCDHGADWSPEKPGAQCANDATTYCSGCECWRCEKHDCACDEEFV